MGFLTDYVHNSIQYNNHRYQLDLAYDGVLNVQKLFKDENISDMDHITGALEILCKKPPRRLRAQEQAELLTLIFRQYIQIQRRKTIRPPQRKAFDFELDGEYIYASFLQAYGIDLIDQQGKLSWRKFMALFEGLPADTKMKEIIKIRLSDPPEPNQGNWKERRQFSELQSYYQLPVEGGGGQDGLNRLFGALEAQAMGGG